MRHFIILFAFLAAPAFALQSYVADYALSIRGISAGKVRYEMHFRKDSYDIIGVGKPSFAAKVLGYGDISERARGKIIAGKVIPQSYQRSMQGDADFALRYDYANYDKGQITIISKKGKQLLHFDHKNKRPLDILALIVQSLVDAQANYPAKSYTLLSENSMRTYQIKTLPRERFTDEKKKSIWLDVYSQKSGDRETKIYFAASPLRLVKLQQLRKKESRFGLNLLNYKEL